jgi:hypothetical protein
VKLKLPKLHMSKQRFALRAVIVGLVCLGVWFAARRKHEVVSIIPPTLDERRHFHAPAMLDDDTVAFYEVKKGIYLARQGVVELASTPEVVLGDTHPELDASFVVVGNKAYYVSPTATGPLELVVCEGGVAAAALDENERRSLFLIAQVQGDGKTVVFSAHSVADQTRTWFAIRDGRLDPIGRRLALTGPKPTYVFKDENGAVVENDFTREFAADRSPHKIHNWHDRIQKQKYQAEEAPFTPSVRGGIEKVLVDGDRYFVKSGAELAVVDDGKVTTLLTAGQTIDNLRIASFGNDIDVGGGKAALEVNCYDQTKVNTRVHLCVVGIDGVASIIPNAPQYEYGYRNTAFAIHGDRLAVVQSAGFTGRDKAHLMRLAVRSGETLQTVVMSDDSIDGIAVRGAKVGAGAVSAGGNVAFLYSNELGNGIAIGYPRLRDALWCGLSLAAACLLLIGEIVLCRKHRRSTRCAAYADRVGFDSAKRPDML